MLSSQDKSASEKISKLLSAEDVDSICSPQPGPVVLVEDRAAKCGSSAIVTAKIVVAEGHVRSHQVAVGGFRKDLLDLFLFSLEIRGACDFINTVEELPVPPSWWPRSIQLCGEVLGQSR